MYKILNKIVKRKDKIYGIGAPSRASTLINYLGLTNEIMQYVCEIEGSYKIGNYMPGTNIPIVSEKKLYQDKPQYAMLLSWHISKELISINWLTPPLAGIVYIIGEKLMGLMRAIVIFT